MQIKEVVNFLETIAPLAYQEEYDNAGLLTGSFHQEVSGILISLDCIEQVVEEAIQNRCNLIIAHHPIVFKGIKKLNGSTYIERTLIKAIKNDIAIYAIHTNLDNVLGGVNFKIGQRLGLESIKLLAPKGNLLKKLITYVPDKDKEKVLSALYSAGAGTLGNYSECSFQSKGEGTFKPNELANPTLGKRLQKEVVEEYKIEVIYPGSIEKQLVKALREAHPYEEPAFDCLKVDNLFENVGSGAVGYLKKPMSEMDFLNHLKTSMKLETLRYTQFTGKEIKKVALCGGAGSFLLKKALEVNADAYVSADFKYHEFFDAENKILIADIGHYESEVYTKDLIYDFLIEKFSNIAIRISEIDTNPIHYL